MSEIPQKYIDLARSFIPLLKAAGLCQASGAFHPGWLDKEWRATIHWFWQDGRHDEEENRIRITSTVEENITLDVKP